MKNTVLVMVPIKDSLHPDLKAKCFELAQALPKANPDFEIAIYFDYRTIPKQEGDNTPWSKVSRIRNTMLAGINLHAFDYIFWVDADVWAYPPTIITRLIAANPHGVSAPVVLIDGGELFYDWAAFIEQGQSHIEPTNRWNLPGRNLQHDAPYWAEAKPENSVVDMDCVGTLYTVPTTVYLSGVRHEDHPAFTDHFPICAEALEMGRRVTCDLSTVAYHADLEKFGEAWH